MMLDMTSEGMVLIEGGISSMILYLVSLRRGCGDSCKISSTNTSCCTT